MMQLPLVKLRAELFIAANDGACHFNAVGNKFCHVGLCANRYHNTITIHNLVGGDTQSSLLWVEVAVILSHHLVVS
jgi:hypothetical protein